MAVLLERAMMVSGAIVTSKAVWQSGKSQSLLHREPQSGASVSAWKILLLCGLQV
jgi:hypothetical protein